MRYWEYDTRLAAYAVIIDGDNRLLLSHFVGNAFGAPQWTLPGGGVEYAETPEAGMVREVKEETGFDVRSTGLLTVRTFTDPVRRRPFQAVQVIFTAAIVAGELGTLERDGTTDAAAWHPLTALPTPRVDGVDAALAVLAARDPRDLAGD